MTWAVFVIFVISLTSYLHCQSFDAALVKIKPVSSKYCIEEYRCCEHNSDQLFVSNSYRQEGFWKAFYTFKMNHFNSFSYSLMHRYYLHIEIHYFLENKDINIWKLGFMMVIIKDIVTCSQICSLPSSQKVILSFSEKRDGISLKWHHQNYYGYYWCSQLVYQKMYHKLSI